MRLQGSSWLAAPSRRLRLILLAGLAAAAPPEAGAQQNPGEGASAASLYSAPADGGARRWQAAAGGELRLRKSPSEEAPVIVTAQDGAILANMGCAEATDQIWCEVRPFRGGARGYALAAHLRPVTGADGAALLGVDDSRKRARKRKFDAKAEIACAQEKGQTLGNCSAAVARGQGGDATVVATFPNGFTRQLYFIHGEFVSASATMSGAGKDTEWRLEDGLHHIRVDDQRYELPDSFVFGE